MSTKSTTNPKGKLNRVLIALLVLQLAILGFQQLAGDDPATTNRPKKVFGDLDITKVTAVRIVDESNKTVELRQQGGRWLLASGGGYPTKKDKVSDLLAKFPALMAASPVTTEASHHRQLEVAKDKFQREVTLTVEGKAKPLHFFLGSSPGLKRVHLRLAGKAEVLAAGELSTWDLGVAAYDWVDTEYFKVERKEIVSLTLTNSHGRIALTKPPGDSGSWQLEGLPKGKKLKQTEVDSLLGSASAITLQAPVGREVKAEQGLDQPVATLTVITEKVIKLETKKADDASKKPDETKKVAGEPAKQADAAASQPAERRERKTYTIKIGAKKGDAYYAKSSTADFVVTVGSWAADQLTGKKIADLSEDEKDDGDQQDGDKDLNKAGKD